MDQQDVKKAAKDIETKVESSGIHGGSKLGEQFHEMDPAARLQIAKQIQKDQGGIVDSALRAVGLKDGASFEFTQNGDLKSVSVQKSTNGGTITEKATFDPATGKATTYDVETPFSKEHDSYTRDSKTGKLKTNDIEYLDYHTGKTTKTHYDYDEKTGKPINPNTGKPYKE